MKIKEKLQALVRSPLSVKILIAIYLMALWRYIPYLNDPNHIEKLGISSILLQIAIACSMLGLIFAKVRWAWKAGIAECTYYLLLSLFLIFKHQDIAAKATETAMRDPKLNTQATPEQLEMAMNIGLYGTIAMLLLGALLTAFFWYRSRHYFEKQESLVAEPA